jgi:hypothetical protein
VTKIGHCTDIHRDNYKNRRPVPICTTIVLIQNEDDFALLFWIQNEHDFGVFKSPGAPLGGGVPTLRETKQLDGGDEQQAVQRQTPSGAGAAATSVTAPRGSVDSALPLRIPFPAHPL